MSNCNNYPTPEDSKRWKNNANSTNEFVTSQNDTFTDQDGGVHNTIEGINTLAETQRDQFDATFQAQFQYVHIGNISDFVGDTLNESEKLNSYQYPDDSDNWYGPIQSQAFPITIPADPTVSGSGWSLVSGVSERWVADNFSNTNLLSNHNFLTQTPADSLPLPSATPTSYPPGYQIFSGVFANESTGITNLTYIDGRVSFGGGDLYFAVPNAGGIEYVTEFVASVADFDGKPRTRGVSFALVGDEYRVTVDIDALEDVSATLTPLGSAKFEQGGVATGHGISVGKKTKTFSSVFTDSTYSEVAISGVNIGDSVICDDYAPGNNSGVLFFKVVTAGTGVADGGKYIDIDAGRQLEQNMPNFHTAENFGGSRESGFDNANQLISYESYCRGKFERLGFGAGVYETTGKLNLDWNFCGIRANRTTIKYVGADESNTALVKNCSNDVGVDPVGAKITGTNISGDLTIDANNLLDFALYEVNTNRFNLNDIRCEGAKRIGHFKIVSFGGTVKNITGSLCGEHGVTHGLNIFNWTGLTSDFYTTNSCQSYRLSSFSCGASAAAFDPTTSARINGAGIVLGAGIGNEVFGLSAQENTGAGVITTGDGFTGVYGTYLERNGQISTDYYNAIADNGSYWQDVGMIFSSENIFYANSDCSIRNFNAVTINGPGEVSLSGEFKNCTVENPALRSQLVCTAESYSVGSFSGGRVKVFSNISDIYTSSQRTNVYDAYMYIEFNNTVTVPSGIKGFISSDDTSGGKIAETVSGIPAATYNAGDLVELRVNGDLSGFNVVYLKLDGAFGGGGQTVELGVYVREFV